MGDEKTLLLEFPDVRQELDAVHELSQRLGNDDTL